MIHKNTIKRWYLILSGIWVAFWVLDIFFLMPDSPSEELKSFLTDGLSFSVYWTFITAPVLAYAIFWLSARLWNRINRPKPASPHIA